MIAFDALVGAIVKRNDALATLHSYSSFDVSDFLQRLLITYICKMLVGGRLRETFPRFCIAVLTGIARILLGNIWHLYSASMPAVQQVLPHLQARHGNLARGTLLFVLEILSKLERES